MLTVEFPHTAVLYLRYAKKSEPEGYRYVIKTPGGTLLETNARRIKNEGMAKDRLEGQEEKGIQVFLNLIGAGMSREEAQRLAEIGNDLVEKALKLQKS